MKDPELADAPEHPDAIAWEVRHCAGRLDSLSELLEGAQSPIKAQRYLNAAANAALEAADEIDGGGS